jgi:hypothetical protein
VKTLILLRQPRVQGLHQVVRYLNMKMFVRTAGFVAFCFIAWSLGAKERTTATDKDGSAMAEKSTAANIYVWKARPRAAASTSTVGAAEVYLDVVIPPGRNVIIQSSADYSSSSTVAVSVLCTACTTATTSMAALGLVLEARWQGMNATTDIATASTSTFAYQDAGGAIFNVFAELFNLELENKGTSTISLAQVMIFAPANSATVPQNGTSSSVIP